VDEAVAIAGTRDSLAFVIGGATVYEALLSRADRLELTEIDAAYEGDTTFPEIGDAWGETDRDERGEFAFVTYERGSCSRN
jgi:dihydrofolate reductase